MKTKKLTEKQKASFEHVIKNYTDCDIHDSIGLVKFYEFTACSMLVTLIELNYDCGSMPKTFNDHYRLLNNLQK